MRRACFTAVAALLAGAVSWPAFDLAQAAPPCTKAATHAARGADRQTTKEIERRIATDESVAPLAEHVRVTTSEGVVTLQGAVDSDVDRMSIASLAESAPGVRHVEDRLEVRGPWHEPPSAPPAR